MHSIGNILLCKTCAGFQKCNANKSKSCNLANNVGIIWEMIVYLKMRRGNNIELAAVSKVHLDTSQHLS